LLHALAILLESVVTGKLQSDGESSPAF
jgi:hypothetical protein